MPVDLFPETLVPTAAPHIVTFRDARLVCLTVDDEILVAMRPVVEGMGLDWKTQHRKLMADSERFCVHHMTTQMPGDDQSREHVFMPLLRFTGWLMSVSSSKVKPAIRDNIRAYQRECDEVLFRHFIHELRAESAALRALRPITMRVAELTAAGLNRSAIAFEVDRSPNSITYHRRSARRLGLLPQRAAA